MRENTLDLNSEWFCYGGDMVQQCLGGQILVGSWSKGGGLEMLNKREARS